MERKLILYIDDEPINLKLFSLAFQKNYRVEVADSGMEGLKKLDALPDIEIVISDMKMPGMSGIEFVRKAKLSFPDRSYFILSGFDITVEINNAIKEGLIQNYFRKPFNLKEIETAISKAVPKE